MYWETVWHHSLYVLLGIKTCTQYNDVETQEAGERVSFLSQNRHDVNEQDEEGMIKELDL